MPSVLKTEQTQFCFSSYDRLPCPLPGVAAWPQLNLGIAGITAGNSLGRIHLGYGIIGRC